MPMRVRGLEVRAVAAEVRAPYEALVDENVERPVDRRRVDLGQVAADALGDRVRGEMELRLGGQPLPDGGALDGEPLSALA
jgi:hypothetical protein